MNELEKAELERDEAIGFLQMLVTADYFDDFKQVQEDVRKYLENHNEMEKLL